MGAAGQRLGLRLFLEGFETPVVAAQVQININAPATASIQVVPGDAILELKARTMVHLFYWDYTQDNEPAVDTKNPESVAQFLGVTVDEARGIIADEPERISDELDELRGYKLLFSGEVIGVTLMRTPAGRQAVLQCSDFSTYWDTTYQFFVSYSPNGNFLGTSAAVWAGGSSMFDDLTAGHVSVMNEYLRDTPKTPGLQNVKGLMGGIISLLEAMGGVPRHTHGVNDFFTIAELKNHILQQIVAEQNDDTSQRLFGNKAFNDWLSRGMSSLGQLVTFRDMMKLLFKYIYYEVVPNPAPMYVPSKAQESRTKTIRVLVADEVSAEHKRMLENFLDLAAQHARVSYAAVNPAEDAVARAFKINIKSITKGLPKSVLRVLEQAYPWLDKIESLAAFKKTASSNQSNVPVVGVGGRLVDGRAVSGPIANTSAFEPPKLYKLNRAAWLKVEDAIRRALGVGPRAEKRQVKENSKAELDRLHTQIFRPDCFFAAPPKCNVLFPDQYTQFQFSRNFLQEVTRLRLSVDWLFGASSGGLLAEYHFAPATKAIKEIAKKQGNSGIRALLPWEQYSGILPKFETIHEVNYVAGRSERRRGIKGNLKGAVVNYAQRTANFNYMKYRFAARTCEVSAMFSPQMVCGFPAVIIERPWIIPNEDAAKMRQLLESTATKDAKRDDISEMIRNAAQAGVEGFPKAPSQYLGMVAALAHSVSQEGGVTSVVLTHARTHRITDDDFLNVFSKEVTRQLETEIVSTTLDAEELLKKGDWAKLKLLIDATPQNILEQIELEEAEKRQQQDIDTEDSPPLETRPSGVPDIETAEPLSGFGSLLAPSTTEPASPTAVVSGQVASNGNRVEIHGKVKKDRLKDSRRVILIPDPNGKLKPGSKGPKGGKVTQIECFSNAALMVLGSELNKKATRVQRFFQFVSLDSNGNVVPFFLDNNDNMVEVPPVPQDAVKKKKSGTTQRGDKPYFMWRKVIIYEERKRKITLSKLLPVEEALRPPWFSPLYSNWFIGDQIYQKFLGTGSVVDQSLFVAPDGAATFGTGRTAQQDILDKLKDADGDNKKVLTILEEAKAQSISDVPDVESSVDVLAYIYGEVRRLGLDVHRFVQDYTRRPIATMEDIFGSRDLEYEVQGTKLVKKSGIPGFHSTAILDVGGNLLGLLDNPDLQLSRLKRGGGKKSPVSRALDPRPGRMEKVKAYLDEINASSGSLGVGVEG